MGYLKMTNHLIQQRITELIKSIAYTWAVFKIQNILILWCHIGDAI